MSNSSAHAERPTVLVVDDQPTNVQALAKLLKDEYRVQVATSGSKALDIANQEQPPDLILLDIEMPEMDGYEVCRALKSDSRTNRIPVIFVTARDAVEDEELGFRLGAVDYVSKPFHPAIVRARVRNHMRLKIKTDLLEKLAMLDGLTGIPNRRYLNERMNHEWQRAIRESRPLSLVMMDIDYFKPYNDQYGHGAGDDCLGKVAKALQGAITRPADLVARYGGEEFSALLPETDTTGALHVATRFQEAIAALQLPHAYSSVSSFITLSIGVVTLIPTVDTGAAQKLFDLADEALYESKNHGRNRITVKNICAQDEDVAQS
nr:PleD family two-component system response regulator [Thiorhodospira sibirica]